jgi:hypothetical protein
VFERKFFTATAPLLKTCVCVLRACASRARARLRASQAKVVLLDESNDLVFLQVDWTKDFSAAAVPRMVANASLIGCCKMPPPVGGNVGMFNNAASGAFHLFPTLFPDH